MTFFSSLNIMAARLARRGNAPAAERVARAAADLEAGPEFAVLRTLLSDLPEGEAEQVVGGMFPEDGSAVLSEALVLSPAVPSRCALTTLFCRLRLRWFSRAASLR